ncbi:MAG TPA: hypothetical protein VEO95_03540, partial [Chthoniobacteraceae bacterium]|nr:hypothetical protein [Chthoniobacteraceae bacterium]
MADIKFHCPECEQRLAVDESAAGMKIDCPRCRSSLVIPASADAPAKVVHRRQLAVLSGSADSAYEELERKQRELSQALEEAARLRTESERSKTELARAREDLAAAAQRAITPAAAPESESVRAENEQLRSQLADAEAARDLLRDRVETLDAANVSLAAGAEEAAEFKSQI